MYVLWAWPWDRALAAVLAMPGFECAETLRLGTRMGQAVGELLDRCRASGVIGRDIPADDIRRLMCGLNTALGAGKPTERDIKRYVNILIGGLAFGA